MIQIGLNLNISPRVEALRVRLLLKKAADNHTLYKKLHFDIKPVQFYSKEVEGI